MSEQEHPMRGSKWDAAEKAHKELWAAFERYKAAAIRAGVSSDSVIGLHIDKAAYHIRYARP